MLQLWVDAGVAVPVTGAKHSTLQSLAVADFVQDWDADVDDKDEDGDPLLDDSFVFDFESVLVDLLSVDVV